MSNHGCIYRIDLYRWKRNFKPIARLPSQKLKMPWWWSMLQ